MSNNEFNKEFKKLSKQIIVIGAVNIILRITNIALAAMLAVSSVIVIYYGLTQGGIV